jgi:hypothetical protein
MGAMKTVWIGALAIALLGSAEAGWALPAAPAPGLVVTEPSSPLVLIRRHHHRGYGRHSRSRWSSREPGEAMPGTVIDPPYGSGVSGSEQPAPSASPRGKIPEPPPPASTPNRARRGSGSAPAIRWVDPEKSAR